MLRTNGTEESICSVKLRFHDWVCVLAGLEPNEASNSQIIFDHFFHWKRIMEMQGMIPELAGGVLGSSSNHSL